MNRGDPNVIRVELVARALGPLWERLVLVGGCAVGLLITDPARPPVRPTTDVDLVAEIVSLARYYELSAELRSRGFSEAGEIVCRWKRGDLVIDVMPTDERVLGFSNKWYLSAIDQSVEVQLPSGDRIRMISAPVFVATKLEAFYGRGKGNFNQSHDIEDIINLVDGRPELEQEVANSTADVQQYLVEEADDLLASPQFIEAISWHLSPDATSQARRELIIARLRRIAGL